MFIVISQSNPDPMHKQVTDQVKDAIARGTLKAEEKLPSIREMSKELRISPITIKRSYRDLEQEGYIVTRAGLGSFVAEVDFSRLRKDKVEEIAGELGRILKMAARYGISAAELATILKRLQEEGNG
ncbi:MAG: GntR family transcriptional regulator [Candidatus Krumholzibacteria bacterium]|nr:GntR family transcriptional regulator [Candidatus Krumholzibacteria bacterium]